VRASFTEGFDTLDLIDADSLLRELGATTTAPLGRRVSEKS
jgi:hypothetical protein